MPHLSGWWGLPTTRVENRCTCRCTPVLMAKQDDYYYRVVPALCCSCGDWVKAVQTEDDEQAICLCLPCSAVVAHCPDGADAWIVAIWQVIDGALGIPEAKLMVPVLPPSVRSPVDD